jgi:hypothetical protein
LLPAATWKSIMMEAERGAQPAALAGVPLDDSYIQYAQEHPQEPEFQVSDVPPLAGGGRQANAQNGDSAVQTASASPVEIIEPPPLKSQASKKKPPKLRVSALPTPETPDEEIVVVKPKRERGAVVSVFKDMFGLFGNDDDEGDSGRVKRKKRSNDSLVLPNVNVDGGSQGNRALQRLKKFKGRERCLVPSCIIIDPSPVRAFGANGRRWPIGRMRAALRMQRVTVQQNRGVTVTRCFATRPSSALRAAPAQAPGQAFSHAIAREKRQSFCRSVLAPSNLLN